jgi:hypothetical protein
MWLCGARQVDERTDYKESFNREVERGTMSARMAVTGWFASLTSDDQRTEEQRLPALSYGRKEIARLEGFAGR